MYMGNALYEYIIIIINIWGFVLTIRKIHETVNFIYFVTEWHKRSIFVFP